MPKLPTTSREKSAPVLPALLWLVASVVAAALLGVRAQVALLGLYAGAGWLAAVVGSLVSGALLAAAALVAFNGRSLLPRGMLAVAILVLSLPAGVALLTRRPPGAAAGAEASRQWTQLHPTLRAAFWVLRLADDKLTICGLCPAQREGALTPTKAPAVAPPTAAAQPAGAADTARAHSVPPAAPAAAGAPSDATADTVRPHAAAPAAEPAGPVRSAGRQVGGYARSVCVQPDKWGPAWVWLRTGMLLAMGVRGGAVAGAPEHLCLALPPAGGW